MQRIGKAEVSLLVPICPVDAAKPRQNTRNPQFLQGPFGTAEGRKTMTTALETPLEADADPRFFFLVPGHKCFVGEVNVPRNTTLNLISRHGRAAVAKNQRNGGFGHAGFFYGHS